MSEDAEPGEERRARAVADLTPDMVDAAIAELLAVVDARLPERFYRGEGRWRVLGAGLIARMADLLDSIRLLTSSSRRSDALILLRALYEHMVMFCWLAINPDRHVQLWIDHSWGSRRKLHEETQPLGLPLLSEEELAAVEGVKPLPPLTNRAEEVDAYWPERIPGFRPPTHLLAFRGLYTTVYRKASQSAHAEVPSLDDCVDLARHPYLVHREATDDLLYPALAVPFFSMALLVCGERFGWPDAPGGAADQRRAPA